MAMIFSAKLRKIGNSVGVIIPREIINEEKLLEGEMIHCSIRTYTLKQRNDRLHEIIGMYEGKPGFERDKEDRY